MEILIGIGALVLLVVWFSSRKKDDNWVEPRKSPPVHKPSRPSIQKPTARKRPVFDSKTAKPTATEAELVGAAYVVDGDTIVIRKTQIRLFGIDAPELDHPYGQKAKWAMVKLCKGHQVRAVVTEKDAYNRTVAKCYLPDGRDLSAEMVKIGIAIDWPKFSGGIYRELESPDARKKLWLATARQ